ncbi:MAG: diguanylate cyclase [Gallionella sp.]|nr:diguanylate cyclase [Gallionella sp.]MDD4947159.1 diguanylate cyclase [Gallionella sp.]
MATISLNILFVGITQQHVAILLDELRRGGYAPCATVLEEVTGWDDVLSEDFQVLVADSLDKHPQLISQINQLLNDTRLDIVLLAYSQPVSHDQIVEVMHAGAHDFISTNNPARILIAVERELGNVKLRAEQRERVVTDHLLREVSGMILRGWDVVPLASRVCQRAVELFGFSLVWIASKQMDGTVSVLAAAGAVTYLDSVEVRWDDTSQGCGTTGTAIKEVRPVVLHTDASEFTPWYEQAQRYGMQSVLSMPMIASGEVTGAIMFYSSRRDVFDAAAVERFSIFANHVAVGIMVAKEQQQLRLLSSAMNSAINAMFITTREGEIVWFNDAMLTFSGYSADELMHSNPRILSADEYDDLHWSEFWQTILSGKAWRGDLVNRRRDGSTYTVVQNITPLYDDQNHLSHFLAVHQDISEQKELEREIEYLAYHDVLTGLPNRVLFQDRLQSAINQARRDKAGFALFFIDLDGFKQVNDTLGHLAGDRLLQIVAERLRACVREADTVARLSGDEFTVLLRDSSDIEGLQRVADKLIESIAQPYEVFESRASVTASIGISLYPDHAQGMEKLLIYADEAMYSAKQAGKNNYRIYQPKIGNPDSSRLER